MLDFVFALSLLLVVYTYAGYPLLLALLTRSRFAFHRNEAAAGTPLPSVTLLIAAYNEANVIAQRLENVLELDYPFDRLQILVAADGSTDETVNTVRSYADRGVQLSYQPGRQGKMAAINRAMVRAQGEIVVFSDANNLYDRQALRHLVRPFANPQVGAATGDKVILSGDGALGESEGLYWRYEAFIKKQESRLGSTTGVCGEILALRRNLFVPPPPEVINDDFYLAVDLMRRGYDVVYVDAARSYERVSASSATERERRTRIVAGRFQAMIEFSLLPRRPLIAWQLVSHKYMRPLVPLLMLAALASNLLAFARPFRGPLFKGRRAWLLLVAQGLFYLWALLGSRLEQAHGPLRLLYLPTYMVNSNRAALAGFIRFIRGDQSLLWRPVVRRGPMETKS